MCNESINFLGIETNPIPEKWGWKEVPKEPRGYYNLQGQYMFCDARTGEFASATGYSTATTPELRWKKLPILREQAIDHARAKLFEALCFSRRERWFLVEILHEVWLKY